MGGSTTLRMFGCIASKALEKEREKEREADVIPTPLKMELGEGGDPWNSIYGSIFPFAQREREIEADIVEGATAPSSLVMPCFDALDTNHDGVISRAEYQNAGKCLPLSQLPVSNQNMGR